MRQVYYLDVEKLFRYFLGFDTSASHIYHISIEYEIQCCILILFTALFLEL